MATWHQQKGGYLHIYKPEPGKWKCISDKPNQLASVMIFDNEDDAVRYCARTGDTLVCPPRQ